MDYSEAWKETFPQAAEADEDRSYFLLKLLIAPDEYIQQYEPPDEVLEVCPDPDPFQFKNSHTYTDAVLEYMGRVGKTVHDLSWGERYMLSRGYLPDDFPTGRLALGRFIRNVVNGQYPTTEPQDKPAEKTNEMRVIEGACVGKIIDLDNIPGSDNSQKLAYVDVGPLKGEDGKPFLDIDGNELRDIRQIVCGGTDVLKPGHKVLVALPGAGLEGGKKVRVRNWNIPNKDGEVIRYESDGVLLSKEEAELCFYDLRVHSKDHVLILPDIPEFRPGMSADRKILLRIRTYDHVMLAPGSGEKIPLLLARLLASITDL